MHLVLKKVFRYTYTVKLAFYHVFGLQCGQCGVFVPHATHSASAGACLFDVDHLCTWVDQEVYRFNVVTFLAFVAAIFTLGIYNVTTSVLVIVQSTN